jgi:hypothetical protein
MADEASEGVHTPFMPPDTVEPLEDRGGAFKIEEALGNETAAGSVAVGRAGPGGGAPRGAQARGFGRKCVVRHRRLAVHQREDARGRAHRLIEHCRVSGLHPPPPPPVLSGQGSSLPPVLSGHVSSLTPY